MTEPDRDAIQTRQLAALRELIGKLRASNAFYRPILEQAGVDERLDSLETFSARVPVTTKAMLAADQAAHPPFGTNLSEPIEHYTRYHQTSGTTGEPLRWLDTDASWSAMRSVWRDLFVGMGVRSDDRVMFPFSFGPFIGFWLAYEAAGELGCLCLPGGGMSSEARLRMMIDSRATVLCCTPTYAIHLGQVARHLGMEPDRFAIRSLIVAGEPGGSLEAVRQQIAKDWPDATICDHHGMTEVGPATYSPPDEPGMLYLMDDVFYAEIVDPQTLEAVPEGDEGELLLTPLNRSAMPALRYRTGDIVRRSLRHKDRFVLEGGIIGRADDMVTIRGVNIYPAGVDQIVRSIEGIAEYRVRVFHSGAMEDMEITIEPEAAERGEELIDALANAFRMKLAMRVRVVCATEALPRYDLKAKRWTLEG